MDMQPGGYSRWQCPPVNAAVRPSECSLECNCCRTRLHAQLGLSLAPALLGWREVAVVEWRDSGAEGDAGDPVGVVIPHPERGWKIIRLLHPLLQHPGQLAHLSGIAWIRGHVVHLPRIPLQVIELEPGAGRFEESLLSRGEPLRTGSRPQCAERGADPDVGGDAQR